MVATHMHNNDRRLLIDKIFELSKECIAEGEPPFSSLITTSKGDIITAKNNTNQSEDATFHAEIIAIRQAVKKLASRSLEGCTLYTICEPCPMCAFMIREHHVSEVVFCLHSKNMGGFSKWPILQDENLSKLPVFSLPPKVVAGVREQEALEIFKQANFHHMFFDIENIAGKIHRTPPQ